MRIVLDTNVLLVSISDRSPYHWIFSGLVQGRYELCVTTEILLEYAEILEQHMGPEVSESVLGTLDNLLNVHLITSYYRFDLIKKDRDDNKFVDCAIAANANYIISEDKDFRI
jgi:putative PIN family toxin of toxin-antitoxin system